jgi:hypothetical protein
MKKSKILSEENEALRALNMQNKKAARLKKVYRMKDGSPIKFNRKPTPETFTQKLRNEKGYAENLKKRHGSDL